jgi:hypothetical protein
VKDASCTDEILHHVCVCVCLRARVCMKCVCMCECGEWVEVEGLCVWRVRVFVWRVSMYVCEGCVSV